MSGLKINPRKMSVPDDTDKTPEYGNTLYTFDGLQDTVDNDTPGIYVFKPSFDEYETLRHYNRKHNAFLELLKADKFQFHVILPDGLEVLESYEFYECTSLVSVVLPEGFRKISGITFKGCTSLASVTFPEGFEWIGPGAFQGCTSLTSVTFLPGLQTIAESAFEGCTSLTSVTLPEGLKYIHPNAFKGCISLTSITTPSRVRF